MLVALVGQPNSGKSALLHKMTGARVLTSNYPGTTVELVSGRLRVREAGNTGKRGSQGQRPEDILVLDTPGIYSLSALTKEQEVTRGIVNDSGTDLIVNVLDGSNLGRHLSLTLALLRTGVPVIVAVNCADRMRDLGMDLDAKKLEAALGAPVVLTSAVTGEGVEQLTGMIVAAAGRSGGNRHNATPESQLRDLHREASLLADQTLRDSGRRKRAGPFARAELALDRPLWTYLSLGVSLLLIWKFMSWALPSAEAAVRLVLEPVAERLEGFLTAVMPESALTATITGAVSEGLVLPLAVVLPAMILAYALIAFLEDTGLLARYAALGDVLTGALNLPGQALIPFMLGFGCRVPGLLSARILPSPESRRAASLIIATVVPCTATASMAWAVLARFGGNPLVPGAALLISTWLLSRLMRLRTRRSKDPLVLEIPPLRVPVPGNIIVKTHMRLSGFFVHVLPLVIGMNVVIRLVITGSGANAPGEGVSFFSRTYLGIPPQAFAGVMLTMLQRYLAPLFLLTQNLSPREATIAITMVVLGFPCLPSAVTLWREQGPSAVLLSFASATCLFLGWGVLLNLVLP